MRIELKRTCRRKPPKPTCARYCSLPPSCPSLSCPALAPEKFFRRVLLGLDRGKGGEGEEEEEDDREGERSAELARTKAGARKASKAEAEYESDVSMTANLVEAAVLTTFVGTLYGWVQLLPTRIRVLEVVSLYHVLSVLLDVSSFLKNMCTLSSCHGRALSLMFPSALRFCSPPAWQYTCLLTPNAVLFSICLA